jgi:hypothetical protein
LTLPARRESNIFIKSQTSDNVPFIHNEPSINNNNNESQRSNERSNEIQRSNERSNNESQRSNNESQRSNNESQRSNERSNESMINNNEQPIHVNLSSSIKEEDERTSFTSSKHLEKPQDEKVVFNLPNNKDDSAVIPTSTSAEKSINFKVWQEDKYTDSWNEFLVKQLYVLVLFGTVICTILAAIILLQFFVLLNGITNPMINLIVKADKSEMAYNIASSFLSISKSIETSSLTSDLLRQIINILENTQMAELLEEFLILMNSINNNTVFDTIGNFFAIINPMVIDMFTVYNATLAAIASP